jgi:ribonuclease P protein component
MKEPIIKDDSECASHENISLRLTDYNDIFSSFDPRPYSERALSVDFLDEARRASIDKPSGEIELRLMLPKKHRNAEKEEVIKRRLRAHFERHVTKLKGKHGRIVRNGSLSIAFGIVIMFLASFILFKYSQDSLFMNFLIILFEPAGWFLFWEGLDQVIFESKKVKPEMEFYRKMANSDIIFLSCDKNQ